LPLPYRKRYYRRAMSLPSVPSPSRQPEAGNPASALSGSGESDAVTVMSAAIVAPAEVRSAPHPSTEIGGRKGPEPTRFGDWEQAGRCIDF